ncbi:ORF002 [Saltwater crocodilepox virus]|nr:ORF002 [Saltwater crocodilepox virus]
MLLRTQITYSQHLAGVAGLDLRPHLHAMLFRDIGRPSEPYSMRRCRLLRRRATLRRDTRLCSCVCRVLPRAPARAGGRGRRSCTTGCPAEALPGDAAGDSAASSMALMDDLCLGIA